MSYVLEVADLFRERFLQNGILGPEEYTTIADWEKRGIPIEIAEKSIEEVFSDGSSKITSVQELEETIKKHFQAWLQQIPI